MAMDLASWHPWGSGTELFQKGARIMVEDYEEGEQGERVILPTSAHLQDYKHLQTGTCLNLGFSEGPQVAGHLRRVLKPPDT